MKTKTVLCHAAVPVRKDGHWDVIDKEFLKEIPDKGRPDDFCNFCDDDENYPSCIDTCPYCAPEDRGKEVVS